MYTEDYLLRMIRRIAEAVGRWLRSGSPEDRAALDVEVQSTLGLSIATIDKLPAVALIGALGTTDGLGRQRLAACADLLEALAATPDVRLSSQRRAKATALRAALS